MPPKKKSIDNPVDEPNLNADVVDENLDNVPVFTDDTPVLQEDIKTFDESATEVVSNIGQAIKEELVQEVKEEVVNIFNKVESVFKKDDPIVEYNFNQYYMV